MNMNTTRNQQKKWRHLWAAFLVIALLVSMTGCQWRGRKGQNVQSAPDDFWQRVQKEMEENTVVFSNDNNSYCITTGEDGEEVLSQRQMDGTLIQNHSVDQLESLLHVSNTCLYYATWESGPGFRVFWRVPIQKINNGDQLLWEKEEALLQDFLEIPYITDSYVIYESQDGIYKLNLQNGEKIPMMVEKRQLRGDVMSCRGYKDQGTIILDGKLFVLEGGNLYSLEPDSGTVKQIYTGEKWKDEETFYRNTGMVSSGESVYFTCDNETIWQYHKGEEQAVCVISEEDFSKKLKEFGFTKKKRFQEYCITEIFLYQDRVYFWVKEYDEKLEKATAAEIAVLSAPASDLSQVRNESVVSDYLQQWKKEGTSADAVSNDVVLQEMYMYKPDQIEGVVDDKIILSEIRLSPHGRSKVDRMYFAAYDPELDQILERSDIRKVY
ncbi:MAG: hypothetical protein K2K70_10275 [Lachnospiraceae bacterium]|nr:hypothetical protein [Lachnospiraceae bacterium]